MKKSFRNIKEFIAKRKILDKLYIIAFFTFIILTYLDLGVNWSLIYLNVFKQWQLYKLCSSGTSGTWRYICSCYYFYVDGNLLFRPSTGHTSGNITSNLLIIFCDFFTDFCAKCRILEAHMFSNNVCNRSLWRNFIAAKYPFGNDADILQNSRSQKGCQKIGIFSKLCAKSMGFFEI